MPYQSDDDPLVETLNSAVWHVIGVGIGLVLAVFVFVWQKVTGRQTSPQTLEGTVPVPAPPSEKDVARDNSVLVWGLVIGALFFFVLALLTKEGFSHFSIIGAFVCLGAAIWIDQSTPSTSATTRSSTQAVAPAHEPLEVPRRYRIVLPKGASF